MSALVRTMYGLRQVGARALPLGVVAALGAAAVAPTAPLPLLYLGLYGGCLVGVLGWRWRARRKVVRSSEKTLADLEIVLLALVGVAALAVRLDGGFDGPMHAFVYLVIGVAAALARPWATAGGVLGLATIELAQRWLAPAPLDPIPVVWHAALAATFAGLHHGLLRAELVRLRARAKAKVEAELARQHDAARLYRLIGAPKNASMAQPAEAPARGDDGRLARSSVEEIHQAVMFSLDLIRRSMGLHTALLLWLNDTATHLRIAEVSTDGEVLDGPFPVGDGVFGASLSRKAVVSLSNLKSSFKLPCYAGPCPVSAVCVVPVLDHGELRGLLVADRLNGPAFTQADEEILMSATRHAVRAIQNERVFIQLERAKVEQGKLYRAAEALGSASIEADVVEAAVKSAREIAAFDFAAVTLFDPRDEAHEIRAVSGDGAEPLLGARFAHNNGLVSMVVENRHPLPYRGEIEEKRQVVFTPRLTMPPVASVLVLPLVVHDRPLGTLVLGARRRGVFGDAVRPTLEVLARHVAVSLANARMMKKLEDLATTDGLTGLLNKRALLEAAEGKIAASTRFGRQMSVLVTDIDFFKKVNDTHGHDVGDVVIKGLGEILRRAKRSTDAVARFGGEEFVFLCEETDAKGALQLAERVREELGRTAFQTPSGPLHVTCSIGIATFPEAGRDWDTLFKAADEALYASKHGGRNRSTTWAPALRKQAAQHTAPQGSPPPAGHTASSTQAAPPRGARPLETVVV